MQKFNDITPKSRLLRILRLLSESPKRYTKRQLAELFLVHEDTIKRDLAEIKNAGFELDIDYLHRYSLQVDQAYESLSEWLFISPQEQQYLEDSLQRMDRADKRYERVRRKIDSLFDISKLGGSLFTKPFLSKINQLEKAKAAQKVVELKEYRSTNSGRVSDRLVEPFHISPKDDILHAYDIEKKVLRHYRISRIERVETTDTPWQYAGHHHVKATDPFRIVDDNQVHVHIRMKVGAYNELIERFPMTLSCLYLSGDEADVYELDCKVNHRFIGLSNFILGYHEFIVEILEPYSLLEHLQAEVGKIKF